ncbi:unnamed protein product [Rotaria socialis]|uniref:Uncharacterized protein n=1 Tax=Rotaria socialis TaxID=392032 RepID=A0A820H6F4_9BILA|nr:unnamed protein product [Rotaria socialis]CAF4288751.1 unnamed protein product [Rotaria socialis]
MAASKKSAKQTTTIPTVTSPMFTEYRLKVPPSDTPHHKPRIMSSYRTSISNIPKSSLSYPTTIPRPTTPPYRPNYYLHQQQQGEHLLYVLKTAAISRRAASAHISNSSNSNNTMNPLPLHQQPHFLTSPLLPRPHPQYGHFLAYLRRQSLARLRRKQEQEAGNTDTIDTIVKFNSNKSSLQSLQSTSNASLGTSTPEITSVPIMSLASKRRTRPTSSYHQQQRRPSSSMPTNYRLTLNQSPPPRRPPPSTPSIQTPRNNSSADQSLLISPKSVVLTPTNSVIDETTKLPSIKAPYELELSGDMLNYCYVSDSGVKYQGQLLCTSV